VPINGKRLDFKKKQQKKPNKPCHFRLKDKRAEEGGVTSAVEQHSNWSCSSFTVGEEEDCFIKVPPLITAAATLTHFSGS